MHQIIDVFFGSVFGMPLETLIFLRVGRGGEFLFPGHRPLLATFNCAECFQRVQKLQEPAAIPLPVPGSPAVERERAAWLAQQAAHLWAQAAADWNAALAESLIAFQSSREGSGTAQLQLETYVVRARF